MKKKLIIFIALVVSLIGDAAYTTDGNKLVDEDFKYAMVQVKRMLQVTDYNSGKFPRTTNKEGKLVTTDMYDWTPGFFPGSLWYLYEYSKDATIKKQALGWTEKLEPLKTFTQHHDLGFMMYCSYGNAYRLTGNPAYKNILVQSARSLSTRFSPVTGAIKSWNRFNSWHGNKTYYYPVIIDNMMNLELLYFASKATGDSSFRHIATTHALTTMNNQVRKDYSHYHVVCYDSVTGKVVGRETAQGYADNSTWSRGQAWGIYGFTMVYRETHDPRFLKTAIGMADFFLNNKRLPKDKVPYWDFNAGQKGYTPGINSYANKVTTLYRDASAAAITASALLELAMYAPAKKKQYISAAATMLQSLSSAAYRAPVGTNGDFLLMHCVGSIPHRSEIDEPLVYADYYFLEALTRYNKLMKTGRVF
ncbi:glycoside hydrolase family 88 protein [Niabella soli]|uniref:Glycosyl hydrolase family 88 n=1 Tax=Niabella soli DSM 19437 TaxID=929713 RepID=W0EY03_9BACT|nr:glycoside hydrolase family 88 protein [Niabella soli]AHF14453.1 glycosyl hydrolase family 88 [Niabella soli DSM 19437]